MRRARPLHRWLGLALALPLALLALTGLTYRLGRSWFGLDRETGWKIIDVHAGEFLGDTASAYYLLAVGLGLLLLIGGGLALLFQPAGKNPLRWLHRALGVLLCLPLFVSVMTGLAYKLGEEWFHLPESAGDDLMRIHEGAWLGETLKPFYSLLLGAGLLTLVATGLRFAFRRRASR